MTWIIGRVSADPHPLQLWCNIKGTRENEKPDFALHLVGVIGVDTQDDVILVSLLEEIFELVCVLLIFSEET
jgi:hypothetical protein